MVPVLLFISVTGMIGSMQMWEVPKIITAGGPNNMTYTLVYSIQNDAFAALDMGLARPIVGAVRHAAVLHRLATQSISQTIRI